MTTPFRIPFLLHLCCCALLACNKPAANMDANSALPPPATPVTAVTVEYTPLSVNHTLVGSLVAPHQIQIFNLEAGQIIDMPYREGDWVDKGVELVKLDGAVIRAELNKAIVKQRQAEVDLLRMKQLQARNATSENEVAQARTALELARTELDLRRVLLARTTIKAPFSGLISERWNNPGDQLAARTSILTLIDPSVLNVELYVSELQLPELQANQAVNIHIDALGDQNFSGKIQRISPVIDPQTRKARVEVSLDSIPPGARPGQLARITFFTPKYSGLSIPFASLHHDQQGPFVYRIDDQKTARRVSVVTGLLLGDKVEIPKGLDAGDHVVLTGMLNTQDEQAVRIVPQ